jgi:hypothetical protein
VNKEFFLNEKPCRKQRGMTIQQCDLS